MKLGLLDVVGAYENVAAGSMKYLRCILLLLGLSMDSKKAPLMCR